MATLTPGVGLEGVAPGLDCIYGAVCEFGVSARGVGGQPEQVQIFVSTLGGREDRSVFWGVQQDYVRSSLLLLTIIIVQIFGCLHVPSHSFAACYGFAGCLRG